MNDLLSVYEVLGLPSGVQLVSDHGEVTLLVASHDGPNKLTLERVPLGACVGIDTVIAELGRRGFHLGEHGPALEGTPSLAPTATANHHPPATTDTVPVERLAAPAIETPAPPVPHEKQAAGLKKRSGPAKGYTFPKVPCPHCGEPIAQNQLVKHTKACPKRAAAHEPSAPALPPSYGEALPPDHSFRDELLSAIERRAA